MDEEFRVVYKIVLDETSFNEVQNRLEKLRQGFDIKLNVGLNKVDTSELINSQSIEVLQQSISNIESQTSEIKDNLNKATSALTQASKKASSLSESLGKTSKTFASSLAKGLAEFTSGVLGVSGRLRSYIQTLTNMIKEVDPEIKSMLDTIMASLANIIYPTVKAITELIYRTLSYLGLINTKFKAVEKSAAGVNKELKRTLLSIDEINNLANVNSAGGGSALDEGLAFDGKVTFKLFDFDFWKSWGKEDFATKLRKFLIDTLGVSLFGPAGIILGELLNLVIDKVLPQFLPKNMQEFANSLIGDVAAFFSGLALGGKKGAGLFLAVKAGLDVISDTVRIVNDIKSGASASNILTDIFRILRDVCKGSAGALVLLGQPVAAVLTYSVGLMIDWMLVDSEKPANRMHAALEKQKSKILERLREYELEQNNGDDYHIEIKVQTAYNMVLESITGTSSIDEADLEGFKKSANEIFTAFGIENGETYISAVEEGIMTSREAINTALINSGVLEGEALQEFLNIQGINSATSFTEGMKTYLTENASTEISNAIGESINGSAVEGEQAEAQKDAYDYGSLQILQDAKGITDNKQAIIDAWGEIELATKTSWENIDAAIKTSCNNILTNVEKTLNSVREGLNSLTKQLRSATAKQKEMLGIDNFVTFDTKVELVKLRTGTNYVPRDMIAELHEGEAVVPRRFNRDEFFGQTSAEELNLLASINEQLISLNEKDTTIKLDGKSVAKSINKRINEINIRQGKAVFE